MNASLRSGDKVLLPQLAIARDFWQRTVGLIGQNDLPKERGIWIHRCNAIHTCFMRFPIDLIFVDKNLVVKRTVAGVKPWKMTWPVWGASSVIECRAGFISENAADVSVGKKLHVDYSLS